MQLLINYHLNNSKQLQQLQAKSTGKNKNKSYYFFGHYLHVFANFYSTYTDPSI